MKKTFFAAIAVAMTLVFACKPEPVPTPPPTPNPDQGGDSADTTVVVPPVDTVVKPVVVVPKADLLDVVFNEDGTATDASVAKNAVTTLESTAMMTYMNPYYNLYAAHYTHTPGSTVSSGYYRVDFTSAMENGLADGHSLEVLFSANFLSDGSAEHKMFSAMDSGGTGWLISKTARGNCLTFLPHVGGEYRWASSGILPQPGRYYHAVGVWDKEAGKARIYVDGELKNEVDAAGDFKQPKAAAAKWWSIGGDASSNGSQSSWNGDVVIARVYDKVLTAEEVENLYSTVRIDQSSVALVKLDGISYLPYAEVCAGLQFNIYGSGFEAGDKLRLGEYDLALTLHDGYVSFVIPAGLSSGNYTMLLERGSSLSPIGKVQFKIVENYSGKTVTKTIAHRGYYKSNSLPQNSIASLEAACKLGAWGSEFDIWATTDGRVVVNHDKYFPTDASQTEIQSNSFSALSAVRLSNGESVPTLESFLEVGKKYTGVKLVCEVKTHSNLSMTKACIDAAAALVKSSGSVDQVVWIAFDFDACKYIKTVLPGAVVQYLASAESKAYTPEQIKAAGLDGLDYSNALMTSRLDWMQQAHSSGLEVNIWTIDSTNDMLTYHGAGADYITTNYPEVAMPLFARDYIVK